MGVDVEEVLQEISALMQMSAPVRIEIAEVAVKWAGVLRSKEVLIIKTKLLYQLKQPWFAYLNYTHRENCILLNSVQEFTERKAWLRLTFFLCLNDQLISLHSVVTC